MEGFLFNVAMDVNCDLGEGVGNDSDLMKYIGSCNIACGGHAGDFETMKNTLLLAKRYDVKIGAHPSFMDRSNFGRKELIVPKDLLVKQLVAQIKSLIEIAGTLDMKLHHVKPHGALYNMAARSKETAQVIVEVMKNFSNRLFLYVPFNSEIEILAKTNGILVKTEAFADRNYTDDFSLVPRSEPFSVIENKEKIRNRVLDIFKNQCVTSVNGIKTKTHIDTVCVHGDHVNAVEITRILSDLKTDLN